MTERYIGLMSGTSMDGIDAVLVQIEGMHCGSRRPSAIPGLPIRLAPCMSFAPRGERNRPHGVADNLVAREFAAATQAPARQGGADSQEIRAIGSHGQTIRHRPALGFTLQIGNAALLAALTGIDVVADFRTMDMALGGRGAPGARLPSGALCPPGALRVVLNLGGIANISVLPGQADGGWFRVYGFDTGPANTLLDGWYRRHQPHGGSYDAGGQWAASGRLIPALLEQLLAHPYFAAPAPKSTGREMFTLDWLDGELDGSAYAPADVQRTLQSLTCHSIARQLPAHRDAPTRPELFVCGGGAHNAPLLAELAACCPTGI